MDGDFDRWNEKKKEINNTEAPPYFNVREIWWCSVGVNVGSEQQSISQDFSRPVLIIRIFTQSIFWGIPLTTKIKKKPHRISFLVNGIENDALILQMRAFDRKRLIRKVRTLEKEIFEEIIETTRALI